MNERKTIVWFLLIAFGISWPLFLLPMAFGPLGSKARQIASLVAWSVAMWGPGLAAIVATRFVAGQSLGTLNLRRLGPKRPCPPLVMGWAAQPPALCTSVVPQRPAVPPFSHSPA